MSEAAVQDVSCKQEEFCLEYPEKMGMFLYTVSWKKGTATDITSGSFFSEHSVYLIFNGVWISLLVTILF